MGLEVREVYPVSKHFKICRERERERERNVVLPVSADS